MLTKIIQFSVQNKLIISIFVLIWIAYGTYQITQLPIDAVPDITNNQVQVITNAPALGAEDVERLITFPIEQALSNIPGLQESRSMSRFGLSLVTVVFDDDSDIYWARQQVTERLTQVDIGENAGTPQLAPPTTGLGEIYQYVLKPKAGFESKYSLADLRTTQDWIVKRQLLGTPGVADVSTFGGELKQYEVAVQPARLKAMNLTISDVFTALNRNNQNTGGAYIEKGPTVLYIRSVGLAGSLDDIRQIVVKTNPSGVPVLIGHVADVQFGAAVRYGALTMAGKGELTGGIVMMLKDANSSKVIENVKKRVAEIQKTLPEGLEIEPFLDRTKMVSNAISTVETNLLEGALIVVLILVLFLGNLRAGFIVASVIPLSMLFAISMMNLFGVSGNLMSLGALDFGLIVDGAVIIVEAILHHLHSPANHGTVALTKKQMDKQVTGSASRMMNAAVFGQVIILIVYLPILSLSGIEGKMFRPMAQTVAFAIIGAFILSLTYVPMISAVLISRKIPTSLTFADQIMLRLENGYARILASALNIKRILVATSFALFAIAVAIFAQMGGEFIPQLEEGDFATETRLLVGTNLSTTITAFNKITDKLKKDFPEVEKIVSRIGSAEIPTDPMPIEGGDMIIVLKDKKEWKSAKTFPEMAEKMAASAQQVVPGVSTGFQYPVQMRFNELMTGAKQDVVCKIYGEDLPTLARYAEKLGEISRTVDGTADWYIEKVTGMPQIVIEYNRSEIARYGLNIDDVNRTINAAFAGAVAGQIYEGEKKFDLVVRVGSQNRKSIKDVNELLIATPSGIQLPLYQLASVKEIEGPNQIQRENTRRRIIVGFNVRGRDVESIVEELQAKVDQQLKFQAGYTITYGGAFENLQQAKSRLMIAVPVALLLIFGMLYFAFNSVKDGLLIYTAIPLSAIGGIFALAARGMPFSISAGVGFIALFGVAVLNGIVLLSEFNRIKKEGLISDALELVMTGTKNRLRPVLMTASVASLGFLPMALSNGAGAEVQRPLATVVIGGLISATLLTLFVLPALYLLMDKAKPLRPGKVLTVIALFLLTQSALSAQSVKPIDLQTAIQISVQNNLQLKSTRLAEKSRQQLVKTAFDLPKTSIDADYGQVSSIHNDTRFGIGQSINFPTVYSHQRKKLQADYHGAQIVSELSEMEIKAQVRQLFYDYKLLSEREKLLQYADSLYQQFEERSNLRFDQGETDVLEKTAATARKQQIANQLQLLSDDMLILLRSFNFLLQSEEKYVPATDSKTRIELGTLAGNTATDQLPQMQLEHFKQQSAFYQYKTEKAQRLPDFKLGYNNQSLIGVQQIAGNEQYFSGSKRFSYVTAGIGIPLFSKAFSARIDAAKTEWERTTTEANQTKARLETELSNTEAAVGKFRKSLSFYEQQALSSAEVIITTANQQLQAGEIDYLQWVILVDQAITIKSQYLDAMLQYNTAAIQLLKLNNL
ncbi:CusA/CzcA family heavy metal efflux RND transporter [Dyadobacter luteus]|uniref:CusA/CzcA family heavy metal efflux RND transporter n=1 Tax=Dyadobacter luteus TaxID=2259619 RepID=A0A3D8YEM1_9BACT|nr:CusA/CzcA family heavy metal efflux RND transporter [Dyadobacter luteus]REA63069.1 CusA/CzcA family heavy metal efflux RND transporter [Dyadobacter luteus]